MNFRNLVPFLVAALLLPSSAAGSEGIRSKVQDRESVHVTVYNNNLGLGDVEVPSNDTATIQYRVRVGL